MGKSSLILGKSWKIKLIQAESGDSKFCSAESWKKWFNPGKNGKIKLIQAESGDYKFCSAENGKKLIKLLSKWWATF
jgi:hypothetical protein